jgi:predicted Zn-dependent protease
MVRRRLLSLLVAPLLWHGAASAVTQDEVAAGAARIYRERIEALRAAYKLDSDERFAARVGRIARPLIAQAVRDYPASAGFAWEVHMTPDGDPNASSMAGGLLLVGGDHVSEMSLSDAELAMLLAHEIAHAALLHNLQEAEEAIRLVPSWATRPYSELEHAIDNDGSLMRALAGFNASREVEADREGMRLAWRAGWPAGALAGYFRKLARTSRTPNMGSAEHPSPNARWQAARILARQLDGLGP